jgi:hypothetical protein
MIVDKDGNAAEPQKEQPHKFGHFIVPEGAHISGFQTIDIKDGWDETPRGYKKKYSILRCQKGERK